jgi:hypothetical protein
VCLRVRIKESSVDLLILYCSSKDEVLNKQQIFSSIPVVLRGTHWICFSALMQEEERSQISWDVLFLKGWQWRYMLSTIELSMFDFVIINVLSVFSLTMFGNVKMDSYIYMFIHPCRG